MPSVWDKDEAKELAKAAEEFPDTVDVVELVEYLNHDIDVGAEILTGAISGGLFNEYIDTGQDQIRPAAAKGIEAVAEQEPGRLMPHIEEIIKVMLVITESDFDALPTGAKFFTTKKRLSNTLALLAKEYGNELKKYDEELVLILENLVTEGKIFGRDTTNYVFADMIVPFCKIMKIIETEKSRGIIRELTDHPNPRVRTAAKNVKKSFDDNLEGRFESEKTGEVIEFFPSHIRIYTRGEWVMNELQFDSIENVEIQYPSLFTSKEGVLTISLRESEAAQMPSSPAISPVEISFGDTSDDMNEFQRAKKKIERNISPSGESNSNSTQNFKQEEIPNATKIINYFILGCLLLESLLVVVTLLPVFSVRERFAFAGALLPLALIVLGVIWFDGLYVEKYGTNSQYIENSMYKRFKPKKIPKLLGRFHFAKSKIYNDFSKGSTPFMKAIYVIVMIVGAIIVGILFWVPLVIMFLIIVTFQYIYSLWWVLVVKRRVFA